LNIKNIIRTVLIMILLLFIGEYLPILSTVIVGIPVSLLVLYKKENFKPVILSIGIFSFVIYFGFGFFNMLFVLIFTVLNISVLIYSDKNKLSALITQILLFLAILISLTFTIYVITTVNETSILEMFKTSLEESENILASNSLLAGSEFNINEVINQILSIIPFMVILLSSMNAIVMYFLARYVLKKMNFEVLEINNLSDFKLPMHFVYGITFILFLSYIVGAMNIVSFNSISLNVILIMLYIFAFQGAAVLSYFLDKKNVAKIIKITLILILMLFQGIFILAIVGWLDMIFNFRRVKKSEW